MNDLIIFDDIVSDDYDRTPRHKLLAFEAMIELELVIDRAAAWHGAELSALAHRLRRRNKDRWDDLQADLNMRRSARLWGCTPPPLGLSQSIREMRDEELLELDRRRAALPKGGR